MALFKTLHKRLIRWLVDDHHDDDRFPLCDFERIRYELRPCDVILIEGKSRVSNVIRAITQSPWTHSALYLGRLHDIDNADLREKVMKHFDGGPDTQLIIEGMLGKGTIVSPLHIYKKDHIRICRPHGISRQDAQEVIAHCVDKLGVDYDVRQIIDLARFFYPWGIMPRHWRSSIFSHHPGSYTKTVCSTVIAEAFTAVNFPILPVVKKNQQQGVELIHRNPRLYSPRDFDYSPYFEIIKYPFIQVVEQGIYRQLPWNQEGLMSNDHKGIVDPKTLPMQQPILLNNKSKHAQAGSEDKDDIEPPIQMV